MVSLERNSGVFSIIIPNFNGRDLLEKNLPSVLNAKANVKNKILEIIVVDDASEDDSYGFVKSNFPDVRLIRHRINRGFPTSVNTGVRSSQGKFAVLLNSDVSVDKNFLQNMDNNFIIKNVFGVSLHEMGFGWAKGIFKNGFIQYEGQKEDDKIYETFWVNGGSGVFRRSMWMKLKGMDEKLFSPFYWEDVDISYRAQKRGWKLLWDPRGKVIHEHESTVSKIPKKYRQRIQERNQLLFIWKNLTSGNLSKKHIAGLLTRLSKHPGYIIIVVMALSKFRGIRKARKKEKKECKVSDEAIFAKFR